MKIEDYEFGKVKINGKKYEDDLIIIDGTIYPKWWRKEGHNLHLEDLTEIFSRKPDTLIVGTGFYGRMKVSEEIEKELEQIGCKLIVKKTKDAAKIFNEISDDKTIALAIHLTC
ncbi:MAG: hypothetical protein GF411_03890 [Candidatus Lokiarchaeota archaeon]|nr:hypothetical protein [Candidatus Lokiarchaeota archaeon]